MFHPRPIHGVSPSIPVRPTPERSPPKLCDNGRAYITDPTTGQLVCLCQLDAHTSHGMPSSHPALRGIRTLNASPRPAFSEFQSYHAQLSAMASLGDQTTGILPPHIAFHPYGSIYAGMEVGGSPLRKAATRETTGPLKAWLGEHKKNPYPTKAEKIMLAIITKMTLTQVSTWFANARRRLKKDNRMGGGGEAEEESDREGDSDCVSVSVSDDAKTVSSLPQVKLSSEGEADPDSFSDISDEESDVFRPKSRDQDPSSQSPVQPPHSTLASPSSHKDVHDERRESPKSNQAVSLGTPAPGNKADDKATSAKPKIWSISHILDS